MIRLIVTPVQAAINSKVLNFGLSDLSIIFKFNYQ